MSGVSNKWQKIAAASCFISVISGAAAQEVSAPEPVTDDEIAGNRVLLVRLTEKVILNSQEIQGLAQRSPENITARECDDLSNKVSVWEAALRGIAEIDQDLPEWKKIQTPSVLAFHQENLGALSREVVRLCEKYKPPEY